MTGWKGTPGPWRADRNHGCKSITAKVGAQHKQAKRTEVATTPGLWDDAEDQANAHGMAAVPQLVEAAADALAGWRYIRQHHGDLYGVGWDRVEQGLEDALRAAKVLP